MIKLRVTSAQADHVRRWLQRDTDDAPERAELLQLVANAVADPDSGVSYLHPLVRTTEKRPLDHLRDGYVGTWADILASYHLRWQPDAADAGAVAS